MQIYAIWEQYGEQAHFFWCKCSSLENWWSVIALRQYWDVRCAGVLNFIHKRFNIRWLSQSSYIGRVYRGHAVTGPSAKTARSTRSSINHLWPAFRNKNKHVNRLQRNWSVSWIYESGGLDGGKKVPFYIWNTVRIEQKCVFWFEFLTDALGTIHLL